MEEHQTLNENIPGGRKMKKVKRNRKVGSQEGELLCKGHKGEEKKMKREGKKAISKA